MSDTPRTDDAQFGTGRVSVDFARELERELNAANRQIEADRKAFDILIEKARVKDGRELLEWVETMTERIENMESDVDELRVWKRYGTQNDNRINELAAHIFRLERAGDACAETATTPQQVAWNRAKEARP